MSMSFHHVSLCSYITWGMNSRPWWPLFRYIISPRRHYHRHGHFSPPVIFKDCIQLAYRASRRMELSNGLKICFVPNLRYYRVFASRECGEPR
jgi:hypothetical protein